VGTAISSVYFFPSGALMAFLTEASVNVQEFMKNKYYFLFLFVASFVHVQLGFCLGTELRNVGTSAHRNDSGFHALVIDTVNSTNGIGSAPCQIRVMSATPSACNASNQTYSLAVVVTYSDPAAGNILIATSDGATISVPQTASPQTINLPGLVSNGLQKIDVTASFVGNPVCTHTFIDAYNAPNSCYAQMQTDFDVPGLLSTCNLDTVCFEITNNKGLKNSTYGNATVEFDIPGEGLIHYVPGFLYSLPAGVTLVSYANNKLVASFALPAMGSTKKICFVIRPDCNLTTLPNLPRFHATVTYPIGYPTPFESVTSVPTNIGSVTMTHSLFNLTTYGNPTPAFGAQYPIVSIIRNTGYGSQNELIFKSIVPKAHPFSATFVYSIDLAGAYTWGGYINPVITSYSATHNLHVYTLKGANLGPDGLFTPGERISPYEYLIASQTCATFSAQRWAEILCGGSAQLCNRPDTLYSTITQSAGTPKLEATLVSIQQADGCPNKQGVFKVKNTGIGSASPVGNAYDVDLGISFGSGSALISNTRLNGILFPTTQLLPNGLPSTNTTLRLKNLMTSDPDGVGVGIADLDGDGFFDDMAIGAETQVSFEYTIPCNLACGVQLDYKLTSINTFTDFCRNLVGSTSTQIYRFGFEQLQAITQLEQVDYGTLTTGQTATRIAKFSFQYKQHNMNLSNASGQLIIRYNRRMEVNPSSIFINGAAPTNTPILMGSNATGAVPDNDSMYVVNLTPTELAAMFDATADNLWYTQTYYGCDIRQNTTTGDNWQLLVKLNQSLCSNGTSACSFDLACKKPFVYSYNVGCLSKPCYIQDADFYRDSPRGYTSVAETALVSPIDSARSWTGDTVALRHGFFMTSDVIHEPNGFYTAQGKANFDLHVGFALKFSVPDKWNGANSIWNFVPNASTVSIYQRTPDPADIYKKGTIGVKIVEVPLILADFTSNAGNIPATSEHSFQATEYNYGPGSYGTPEWYCNTEPTTWHVSGICPAQNKVWTDVDYNNISCFRYINAAEDKISDCYYINAGKALARAGWNGNTGDDNYYFVVNAKWRMNPDFPWNNSNSISASGWVVHYGDYQDYPTDYQINPASTYNSSCGTYGITHQTTDLEMSIGNPNSVYSSDCSLNVKHDIFNKSSSGKYFTGGEVRVPYKVDSVVVDLPNQFGLTAGTFLWKYNQSCSDLTSNSVVASATAGHIVFTPSGGGTFPRADDCSGNELAYQLSYTVAKTGTAAPTQYRYPVKIYGKSSTGAVQIFADSVTISEVKPVLTLTPVSSILTPSDGGACEPASFDFLIQNNSLFDAGYTYLAAASSAGTTMVWIGDGDNVYLDPIEAIDVSTYGTNNVLARLGTIKAGTTRRVRVYANTSNCSGTFNVYADFGCSYPTQPNLASVTIKTAAASYQAQPPIISTLPSSDLNVASLCEVKTVEVELRNVRLGNLYKGNVLFNLPPGVQVVSGTAQYRYENAIENLWANIPAGDVTSPGSGALNLNLLNIKPFNTACGLPGADEFARSHIKIRFNIEFTACPSRTTDYILYTVRGENYCGTQSQTQAVLRVNFVGAAVQNNYDISYSSKPIVVCELVGQTSIVKDTITIKNLGGLGAQSGTTTGADQIAITVVYDTIKYKVSNVSASVGFNVVTTSLNANGNLVIHTNVPAGIAINGSQKLILTYHLLQKVNLACKTDAPICYSATVSTDPNLVCAAKGLNCAGAVTRLAGIASSIRPLACCYLALGNLVFIDQNKSGKFEASIDSGVKDVEVKIFESNKNPLNDPALFTTKTLTGGYYIFDQLDQGSYFVYIPGSEFAQGKPLYQKTSSSPEGTGSFDDNTDEDGLNTPIGGGFRSRTVNLIANTGPTNEPGVGAYPGTLTDDNADMTIDLGFSPSCILPVPIISRTHPTCNTITPQNNGTITLNSATSTDKWGISTINSASYNGPNYASASPYAVNTVVKSAIPNTGGSFIIRLFSGFDDCYKDTTIIIPAIFCDAPCTSPLLAMPCYVFGGYQGNGTDAFVSLPMLPTVPPAQNSFNMNQVTHLGTHAQVGSLYGTAYNAPLNKIYSAAYIKRHTGLGPGGTGAIYQIDPLNVTPPSVFVDLNALFGANTAGVNPHPYGPTDVCPNAGGGSSNFACWFNDVNAWNAVGRQGLGDLDVSKDGQFLYVMNMTNKSVYKIPTTAPTASNIQIFPFPTSLPGATQSCGDPIQVRPMGLGVYGGRVFAGAVCSQEVDSPLGGNWGGDYIYIYALDPISGVWTKMLEGSTRKGSNIDRSFSWPANYTGTYADANNINVSDIEFTNDGQMIIGLRDISGDKYGADAGRPIVGDGATVFYSSAGDVVKACLNTSTNLYELEVNGVCGGVTSTGPASGEGLGPSATAREFFWGDYMMSGGIPLNMSLGGLAYNPGNNQIYANGYDILGIYEQGLFAMDNATGARTASYVLISGSNNPSGFGKANGFGDLDIVNCCTLNITARDSSICGGNGVNLATLTVNVDGGTGAYTYHSSRADALNNANPIALSTVSPATTTKYYIKKSIIPSCFDIDSVLVTVYQPIVLSLTAPNPAVCIGGSTTLTVSPANITPDCTLQWQSFNGTIWQDISGATGTTYTVSSITTNANYRVRATCTMNRCADACPPPGGG
jgi:hypothetical protein